ncbi:hypothetical protein KFK09_018339 [Dendrobium nobile]|uniref:U-box domain-containing protein n=1 Tax=Dendrobium nobile TaxID=94219 RepID=A0A8T3AVH6_DENNO|nr:hypothetical protein KFK09_018339 [Dendrobium nobile]
MTTDPEFPSMFRCPISLELMENPVTVSTGISYERRSIEKWLFTYKKTTCPATMQLLSSFDLIPNHTLKNLILSWRAQHQYPSPSSPASSSQHLQLTSIFSSIKSSPFKANSLKQLRSFTTQNHSLFIASGGVEALRRIIIDHSSDYTAFRACEEALGLLNALPFDDDDESIELLSNKDIINSILVILQRGSAEARLHAITILQRMSTVNPSFTDQLHQNGFDAFKSLLDLLSDDISTRLSSSSLDLLLTALANSKPNRLSAIEAGAVCVLIELLPDAGRHKGERTLLLLKRLCECAEGRRAFADHGLGVAAVSSKIGREFDAETKLAVKVLWLVCSFLPTKKVVDEMMVCGAVKKLLGLIHVDDGQSSTKEKALKMVRMHGDSWRQSPCFPCELRAVQYF